MSENQTGQGRGGAHSLFAFIERLATRRAPKLIAGGFFSTGTAIVLGGFLRGDPPISIMGAVLVASAVAVIALGVRYLESRCPRTERLRDRSDDLA